MAAGEMELDFDTLLGHYPVYTRLPRHIQDYINELNRNLKEGEPRNTPCCLQVSEGLNYCGDDHKIPERSYRRRNAELPYRSGKFFLGAVDELERHLTDRYGAGDPVKTAARRDTAAMKAYLAGKRGILVFRNGGAGFHTELWDRTTIIQSAGAPANNGAIMNEAAIFGQPRVVFWEAVAPAPAAPAAPVAPDWLPGWWEVRDGFETDYYYFFPYGTVHHTRLRPALLYCPATTEASSGQFTVDPSQTVTVEWNDGGRVETFTPDDDDDPPTLSGTHPGGRALPFTATKIE